MINLFRRRPTADRKSHEVTEAKKERNTEKEKREAELRRLIHEQEVARVNARYELERRKAELEVEAFDLRRRDLDYKRAALERRERNDDIKEAKRNAEIDRAQERISYLMTRIENLEKLQDNYIERLRNPKSGKEEAASWSRMIVIDNQIETARKEIAKLEAILVNTEA